MANNYNPHNNPQMYSSSPPQYNQDPYASSPPPPPQHRQMRPGMHPDSRFNQLNDQRGYGASSQQSNYQDARENTRSPSLHRRPVGSPPRDAAPIDRNMSPSPPLHPGMGGMPAYPPPTSRSPYQDSPRNHNGHGNFSPAAAGAAMGAGAGAAAAGATHNDHFQPPGNMGQYAHHATGYSEPSEHEFDGGGTPYRAGLHSHDSYSSDAPFAASAMTPGMGTPNHTDPSFAHYHDYSPSPSRHLDPYQNHQIPTPSRSHEQMMTAAAINPNEILDDGDDFMMHPKRASRVNLPFNSNRSKGSLNSAGAMGAGAIGDDVSGGFQGDAGGNYGPLPAKRAGAALGEEKSPWMASQKAGSKRWKKFLFIGLALLIIIGIVVGAVVGVLSQQKSNKNEAGGNAAAADDASGDLSKDSAEIKKLMNNPNLHKVFSGFAYTPFAAQYPDCLTRPPSQNNITRDMAMLGQLTNVIRLYGTDCNQTEMVLHAIDRLQLTDMKIWVGAWLGNNDTTNTRQINQMWKILDARGTKNIKGVVIGNEVLFRKDLTDTQLGTYLSDTKTKLTSKGLNLPVATSDLGDNWTAALATEVDVVMSNIHPFFGGVAIDQAASWTYSFWQSHDVAVTAGMTGKQHIISEFGWPSGGGNDCGTGATCTSSTEGAVANIDNMNTLMSDWVCQALSNGTDYFWFEAFDEPWKIQYNTPGKEWEDKWGIMDINRNLKKGLKIPSCGGASAPAA